MTPAYHAGIRRLSEIPQEAFADTDWLCCTEEQRLNSLRNPHRRQQYLAGHWLLREQLQLASGLAAKDWLVEERRGKPPALLHASLNLHASISHSGEWVAAAVGPGPLGIDIEARARDNARSALESVLLKDSELPDSLDMDELLTRWVAIEAHIKRQHGAALPEQIRRLRLEPAEPATAPVRVYRSEHYLLALAADAELAVVPPLAPFFGYSIGEM